MKEIENDADFTAKPDKDAAHREEIKRLNEVVAGGGKLDEIEDEQQGIQVKKAHKDLLSHQESNAELLYMRLKETPFPLCDAARKDIQALEDLFNELVDAGMAVGLAAQQAHVTTRACCVKVGSERITMINPEIVARNGKKRDFEGCLSIDCVQVEIKRPRNVTVAYYDKNGERHLLRPILHRHSRRVCHEVDHLNGITIKQYVKPDSSNVRFYLPDWA